MDAAVRDSVLADFGITSFRNAQGKLVWTLGVITTTHSEPQSRPAYFDETLAEWRFGDLVSENENPAGDHSADAELTAEHVAWSRKPASHLEGNDWVDSLPTSGHLDFFKSNDWATTPLGCYSQWSHSLRLYTHMLFSDSRAAAIYWGPQRIAIYNEHLLPLIGALHPMLMSRSFESVMPEIWDFFGPDFHAIETDQAGIARNGLEFPLARHGYLEETWWDGGLVALKDDHGRYGGVYFSWVEVTRTVLRDRRTALVNRLRRSSLVSSSLIWQHIHDVFADCPRDIPMAVMYSAEDTNPDEQQLRLEHTIGILSTYTAAPETLDVSHATCAYLAPLMDQYHWPDSGRHPSLTFCCSLTLPATFRRP